MMRADIYYGVQFAQSLYLLLWQSGRIEEIPKRVFSIKENVQVHYDGTETCMGQKAVEGFFYKMTEKTRENEGFLRMDMPATQFIEMTEDGTTAIGHWTTMTRILEGQIPGGDFDLIIGQFTNEFVLEDDIWKLKSVCWEEKDKVASWTATPDMNLESYQKEPRAWIDEIPALTSLSMEGVTDRTIEIIKLRNEVHKWLYEFNCDQPLESGEICLPKEMDSRIWEMLENCMYILATSPVISLNDEMTKAEGFWSVTLLKRNDLGKIVHIRGGMHLVLDREGAGWSLTNFTWNPYATLDAWTPMEGMA